MIYLLGGSGYVGQAYQTLLTQKGIPFRNLRRAVVNYADPAVLTAALRADKPAFLINAAGYTGKPNVDACELHKAQCLDGNAVLPGHIAEASRGTGGFGYDPVFVPTEGDGRTFAEMSGAEKNQISHRARAVAALVASLNGE